MSDKNKPDSVAAKAGRWFARLIGRGNVEKLAESARALKQEFDNGKRDAEDEPPRTIPHRVVGDDES